MNFKFLLNLTYHLGMVIMKIAWWIFITPGVKRIYLKSNFKARKTTRLRNIVSYIIFCLKTIEQENKDAPGKVTRHYSTKSYSSPSDKGIIKLV